MYLQISAGRLQAIFWFLIMIPLQISAISATSRFNTDAQDMNANKSICVSKSEAVSTTHHEESKDDLFASDYDIIELLANMNIRSGCILTVPTPS